MISINKCTLGFFPDTIKYAKIQKNNEAIELQKLNLSDIISVDFPENQYFREETKKSQIVLHHTVSGQGVNGDIAWWRSTADRVATAIIIGWDGKIYQCFESGLYWAHHLGLKTSNNKALNMASIGVEIDAWGGLVEVNKLWYPAKWDEVSKKYVANTAVRPIRNVQVYEQKYRGFYGFEKYTNAQIQALRKLLIFWNEKYGIPLKYNADMFDVSSKALAGQSGIWSHTSYRSDKSDVHPQPELIQMLKSL